MINAREKVKGIYLAREENSVVGHLIYPKTGTVFTKYLSRRVEWRYNHLK